MDNDNVYLCTHNKGNQNQTHSRQDIKAVTLLDVAKGEVVMIKFTESEQQEMKQYDDFSEFLSTLEDIYQFELSNCQYICSDNVRKIGYATTEEEYAQEVLKNDVLKSDGLEDYYQQQLGKATEDDKKEMMADFVIRQCSVGELVDELELDHVRCCSVCGRAMTEGYCIESGFAYYCSDECMSKEMTREEFLKLYDDGNGDSYWTTWD